MSIAALFAWLVWAGHAPCSNASAEWLSSPKRESASIRTEEIWFLDRGPVRVRLGAGRFVLRVAPIHRWDLVASVQSLQSVRRGGGFLLPKLEWIETRFIEGPRSLQLDGSSWNRAFDPWFFALVTEQGQDGERFVWGRIIQRTSLQVLVSAVAGGAFVALFDRKGRTAGQTVEFLDASGEVLETGRTGPDGVFVTSASVSRARFLVAGSGRRSAVSLLDFSRDRTQSHTCSFLDVRLEPSVLRPGGRVAVTGLLAPALASPAGTVEIVAEQGGSGGLVVGHLPLSPSGLFGGTLRLPENLLPGVVLLRVVAGRCERLLWLPVAPSMPDDRISIDFVPSGRGIGIVVRNPGAWTGSGQGHVRLRWGWMHSCGQEAFAGGTAEACLDGAGRTTVPLSIPKGGRCLWVAVTAKTATGWDRAASWWPGQALLDLAVSTDSSGWSVGVTSCEAGAAAALHVDDGGRWPCRPVLWWQFCPFRSPLDKKHLVWKSCGSRDTRWAWIGKRKGSGDSRLAGISAVVRNGRVIVEPGWRTGWDGGFVFVDWFGRLVWKVLRSAQPTRRIRLHLPQGALGPVRVVAGRISAQTGASELDQTWLDIQPSSPWILSTRTTGSLWPGGAVCVGADRPGRFLLLGADQQGKSVLLGASGSRPSLCVSAPRNSGRLSLSAVGVFGRHGSWIHRSLDVKAPQDAVLRGPKWVRPGDRICTEFSWRGRDTVSYRIRGLRALGVWPRRPGARSLLCGRVDSGGDVEIALWSKGLSLADWQAGVEPDSRGGLVAQKDPGEVDRGDLLCSGSRCALVGDLVRLAAEPLQDAGGVAASALSWTCLLETGNSATVEHLVSMSVRNVPGRSLTSVETWLDLFGHWMGPEGLVLSDPFGSVASDRVQAAVVWALVRRGDRQKAAALARGMETRLADSASRSADAGIWTLWALLEAGLMPVGRWSGHLGGGVGALAVRLWSDLRSGAPISVLDARLGALGKSIEHLSVRAVSGRLAQAAVALHILDQVLPGHRFATKLASLVEQALMNGGSGKTQWDPLARALTLTALWAHRRSALTRFVSFAGSGHHKLRLSCNGQIRALDMLRGRAHLVSANGLPSCPVFRLTGTARLGPGDVALALVGPHQVGGRARFGVLILSRAVMHRPCVTLALPAGLALARLVREDGTFFYHFPWTIAQRSKRGFRVCVPRRIGPGLYLLEFDLDGSFAGRYRWPKVCMSEVGGRVVCDEPRDVAVTKENP